jgi:hypothetical protein
MSRRLVCVNTDFVDNSAAFNIERVTQTASSLFFFQFLVGDMAGTSFQR